MTAVLTEATTTPTAVTAYDGPPQTPGWFAARRAGITGTDLPALVCPDHKWRTPLHVWLDKRGELPEDPGSHYAEAGTRLEPVIARWWADDHQTDVYPLGVLSRVDEPWMRVSPDRGITRCPDGGQPGRCGLEVKNRNAYVAGVWRDDVPDDVLAQVAWSMAVTGWDHVHVAALIGGNTPMWHRVDRDLQLEAYLIGEASTMWAAVLDGTPPEVDASAALTRLLDVLYGERSGGREVDETAGRDLYRLARLGTALEKRGKALRERAKNGAVLLLDDAEELVSGGRALATYRAQSTTGLRADDLKALAGKRPEVHALLVDEGYLTTTTTRVLRWTKRVGDSLVS